MYNLTGEKSPATLRRRVLDMAWPLIAENILQTAMGIVDIFLVAQLGAAAIAGVGSAVQVWLRFNRAITREKIQVAFN